MIRTPSLRSLELFSSLMVTRSLTETAKRIGITQPAVSLALKELEAQTGLSLFTRTRQRIAPTPQAEALMPHIERLMLQAEAVQRRITTLQNTSMSTLQIACIPSYGSSLLPQTIAGFKARNRKVDVRVDVQYFARVVDLVDHDTAEVGIAYLEDQTSEDALLTTQLACVMKERHPLASKDVIQLMDLVDQTVFAGTKGYIPIPSNVLDELHDNKVASAGSFMEITNAFTAMALAREGLGIALASPMLLLGGHATGLVGRPFESGGTLTLGVLRSQSGHNEFADDFVEQARMSARNGVERLRALGIPAS